jgi:hypothetical protein
VRLAKILFAEVPRGKLLAKEISKGGKIMNAYSKKNLGEVLARLASAKRAADGLKADRDRIAKMLREARIRVKANKAANGDVYDPNYAHYVANPLGPDPRD